MFCTLNVTILFVNYTLIKMKNKKGKKPPSYYILYMYSSKQNTGFNETLLHLQIYCLSSARHWGHQVNYDMVSYGAQLSVRELS